MRRVHRMPFGADVIADGVRFRLWAPAARCVDLCLALGDEAPMAAVGDGWFERIDPAVTSGSHYRFRIDGGLCVPDPASRFNPNDVHGASEVVDPNAFAWRDVDWRGRPWHEAVIYELHVGSFTPAGTFAGVGERLDCLAELGVTALELMPIADFPGRRNWGYDGVLPFAPDSRYGRPDQLKALVEAAHGRGLMVLLDVVYNHFGPDGNYLHTYAPAFFTERHHTPWGAAIAFDNRTVRDFYVHNALYWLEEFHLDGLRLDAVHAIFDDSTPDILVEIAQAVRDGPGREREIHLVLENDRNAARYLRPSPDGSRRYDAQWNDDLHHALHVLLTGETDGYYADYAADPTDSADPAEPADAALRHLGRCLAEGFAWQDEPSRFRGGEARGEPSADLPPSSFVAFLQNHDQIGNRAFGERLAALADPSALAAAHALLLLAPMPPLLFMGEEFDATSPFLFFCDFTGDLAEAVRRGRREEFAASASFHADPRLIPDPGADETFERSCLDWTCLEREAHRGALERTRALLALRRREIVPRLAGVQPGASATYLGGCALSVAWTLADGTQLTLVANLSAEETAGIAPPDGLVLYAQPESAGGDLALGTLPPWSVVWVMETS